MTSLVTRFHLLLTAITLAITGVALFRVPTDYAFVARWSGGNALWLWPRDVALAIAPVLALALLVGFLILGRILTKNHFAKVQHILDPVLSLSLGVIAATQLGLLLNGFGSELDLIRLTAAGLGITLLPVGVVVFEAERHTYAGLRMPWPIADDKAWMLVHRTAGTVAFLAGLTLLGMAWLDVGIGFTVIGFAAALLGPIVIAAIVTLLLHGRSEGEPS